MDNKVFEFKIEFESTLQGNQRYVPSQLFLLIIPSPAVIIYGSLLYSTCRDYKVNVCEFGVWEWGLSFLSSFIVSSQNQDRKEMAVCHEAQEN